MFGCSIEIEKIRFALYGFESFLNRVIQHTDPSTEKMRKEKKNEKAFYSKKVILHM